MLLLYHQQRCSRGNCLKNETPLLFPFLSPGRLLVIKTWNKLDVWPAEGHHHLSSWPSPGAAIGGPGLQDNRFHTSTRGFCEGLLNARSGRPQKEVTTADSGIGDIPLDPSRCWPWTDVLSEDCRAPSGPSCTEATRAKSVPSIVPRPSTLHAVKSPTFGRPSTKPHPLQSATPPKGGAALPYDHALCSGSPFKALHLLLSQPCCLPK